MAIVSSESFADSSCAGIVERPTRAMYTDPIHHAESAAPSGSSRLLSSINFGNKLINNFNYCLKNNSTKITLQSYHFSDKLLLLFVEINEN